MKKYKGTIGYIQSAKIRTTCIAISEIIITIVIFMTGLVIHHGNRLNVFSLIAALGMIPTAMAIVSMIMFHLQKPISAKLYHQIRQAGEKHEIFYELPCTVHSGIVPIDAAFFTEDTMYCLPGGTGEIKEALKREFISQFQSRSKEHGIVCDILFPEADEFLEQLQQASVDVRSQETIKEILFSFVM